ncbi:MAG: SGNH/GDSL hydrolase family protein, partial [Planctomycetota bacterium]
MDEPPPTRKISRRRKILLSAVTLGLLFLLCEAILSLTGVGFGWEIDAPMAYEQLRAYVGHSPLWRDTDLLEANFSIYRDRRTLLWGLRPGLDLRIKNFLLPPDLRGDRTFALRTNRLGYRGPDPPPGGVEVTSVLCLGGSNTFGWGLAEEETYPHRLSVILNRKGGPKARVLNFGQPGYSSRQGRVLWEGRGRKTNPDRVVLGFGFNDGLKAPLSDDRAVAHRSGPVGAMRHGLARLRTYRLLRHILFAVAKKSSPDPDSLRPRVPQAAYRLN